jgi:GntR family transcriptional repressor for pyruvate dehydrogenase complex
LKPLPPHAYEALAAELEILIRGGHFLTGDRLPSERRLAEQFGVSRPTVRAALAQLESRGLTLSRSGSGTFVTDAEPEAETNEPARELRPADVLDARLAVEVSIARLAARRAATNHAVLKRLRVTVEALERVATPAEVPAELDAAFHRDVAALTGNRYLTQMLEPIWTTIASPSLAAALEASWSPEATRRTAAEHRAIYEALVAGDGELAGFAMERHLRSVAAATLDDSAFDGPPPRFYA